MLSESLDISRTYRKFLRYRVTNEIHKEGLLILVFGNTMLIWARHVITEHIVNSNPITDYLEVRE